ncbi:MAG: substrate-binding domain-containing protein, partial [Anaerolineae bacterium]|nr:substrate-binding domain-containing protein [Anaerolineae bacterium]
MRSLQRRVGVLFLLALLIIAHTLFAQDNTQITVVGSGVVIPALNALATASGVTTVSLSTTVTGTTPGFDLFCQGQADVTTANRPITPDENTACSNAGVDYAELLIGNSIAAVIASPDVTFASCLTTADLDRVFAPSAAGQSTNWNQLNTEYPDLALSVYVPQETTSAFAGIDRMVDGDGLRSDATYLDTAAILSAVENGTGSIGVVNLPEALAAGTSVNTLLVNTNEAVGCQAPSAQNVEGRLYQGGERLFVYVNRTTLGKTGVLDLLTFASATAGADALNGLGLTPPTEETYALNAAALEGTATGSQFVTDTASFTISPDVTGAINIGGSPIARDYLDTATNAFTTSYPGVTITSTLNGEPAGFRRLCNGEIDIAATSNDLTEEAQTNCAANNITPFTIDLGRQAVALVANANTPFLACLTTQQLATAWGVSATAAEPITNWNQVDSAFPDQAMTLFQPPSGNDSTDLLMIQSA